MRGNERTAATASPSQTPRFPIPMRGNERQESHIPHGSFQVPDPHEG